MTEEYTSLKNSKCIIVHSTGVFPFPRCKFCNMPFQRCFMMQASSVIFLIIILFVLVLNVSNPAFQRFGILIIIGLSLFLLIMINRRTEEMKRNEYSIKNLAEDLSISLEQKEYIASIISSMIDTLIVTDENGKIQTANESAMNLLGYKRDELIGTSFESILEDKNSIEKLMSQHSDSLMNCDTTLRTKEGGIIPVSISLSRLIEYVKMDEAEQEMKNKFSSIVCIIKDITERKKAEEKVKYLAYYDSLTGLPNRDLFKDRSEQAIKLADRYKRNIAMLYLDIDNFKNVNDTLGHETGDQLLQQVAIRLKVCLRKSDTVTPGHSEIENVNIVSRQCGDEFIMLLTEISEPEDAAKVAQRILEEFSRPFTLDGSDVYITVSIGIAVRSSISNIPFYELVKNADTAMYHAKEKGKNNHEFFSKDSIKKRDRRCNE